MTVNYYAVDEDCAARAHAMVHMSEYVPGSCTNSYQAAVDQAAALVEERKTKISPYYHDRLDALLDSYSRQLAKWQNDYNRNAAVYPSQFISGAGNFNMRKHNKQMAREGTLWQEYDRINSILDKIKNTGTGGVDLADPHAREILTEQLQGLQATLDRGKALNAYYRKHKSFIGFPDLTDAEAEKFTDNFATTRVQCPWVDKPYPDYELSSLRGKIKRVQARIAELDKLHSEKEKPAESLKFDGGEVVRNAEFNRLQILFDAVPDADTRAALKRNGFRWSPKNQAWQRQLTDNAERAARVVLGLA